MMFRNSAVILAICLSLAAPGTAAARSGSPALESVLQQGFPVQPEALSATTQALLHEYEQQKDIASLIFYSYGTLRMADHYAAVNDYVLASEYGKTGFFYLDEAADSHENTPQVRYLRARIDAYLPAKQGRCVIALADTNYLLKNRANFDNDILINILFMRYRALLSCGDTVGANTLLTQLKNRGPVAVKLLSLKSDASPAWDIGEITQIVVPLMKGE